jgi:subtilisin-like proprotein convertase family protein
MSAAQPLLRRVLPFVALVVLSAALVPARAAATSPPPPPGCGPPATTHASNTSSVAISAGAPSVITSTIDVAGAGPILYDLDVVTSIPHVQASNLDITLASPRGTVVTLTTDNGGLNANVFVNTRWDDDAGNTRLVTDATYADNVAQPSLVPEEALDAFAGEDPNGTWTLTVSDDTLGAGGQLASWSLDLQTLPTAPQRQVVTASNATSAAITDNATTTSTITLSGAGAHIMDVDAKTDIAHTYPADLGITLVSPAGTAMTLSSMNSLGFQNVFAGTTWDDAANPGGQLPYTTNDGLVTDSFYAANILESPLVPEGAFGEFVGENPNGTWTLRVADAAFDDTGTLRSWQLVIATAGCAGSGPGPVPTTDLTAPRITALTLSPTAFAAGRQGTSTAPAGSGAGTSVRLGLSEAARTTFTVERALPGRRVNGRCRPQTSRNRRRAACTRLVLLRGSFRLDGASGDNAFRFTGRLRGRALTPGRYRLNAVSSDAAGNVSLSAHRAFRIVASGR